MQRKLLLAIGLVALFIVTFVVAVFWAFPKDAVRHYAEKSLEKAMKGKQIFEIKDMSVSPLLTVTLNDVTMKPATFEQTPEYLMTAEGEYSGYYCAKYVEVMPFIIDQILVDPDVLKVATGIPNGQFEINLSGGSILGKLVTTKSLAQVEERETDNPTDSEDAAKEETKPRRKARKAKDADEADDASAEKPKRGLPSLKAKKSDPLVMNLNAKGQQIDLNRFAILSNYTGAQFYGELNFDTRVKLEDNQLKSMDVNMTMLSTALCPKRIKVNMGGIPYLELPFTILGDIAGKIAIENGVVTINELKSSGPDLVVEVHGTVTLPNGKNVKEPKFDLDIMVLPSEEWLETNSMDAIYQICRRQADGSIEVKLSGSGKRMKPDCGKPIPVEKPATAPKPAADGDKKAADKAAETAPKVEEKPKAADDKKRDSKKKK